MKYLVKSKKTLMKEKYRIIKDPKYGYLRVDPLPDNSEIERFYLKELYSTRYKKFNDSSLQVQKEEKDFFDRRWESICEYCLGFFGKLRGLSVFDVGFGFAQALLYFRKKGMRISGLEPSEEGIKYAKRQGLDAFQAKIDDLSILGNKRFDVVTILNVLEHLANPARAVVSIREKILKPKGLLVIDVPNEFNDFQLVANQEYNLDSWWLCPPNHINYFSASSLRTFLSQCGYKVTHYEASFPLELFLLMGDVYVGNNKLGKKCHQKRVKFEYLMRKHGKGRKLREFYEALAKLDLGRQVVMYATPSKIV